MIATLQERIVFAESACNYVEERLLQEQNKLTSKNDDRIGAVVSFSFVNTDLRDVFRQKFPQARWFLVDTSEEEANDRILKREGHFYKGKVETATTKEEQARPRSDNEDWNFAPVTFPHILLDGLLPIDHNADTVAKGLLEATYPKD